MKKDRQSKKSHSPRKQDVKEPKQNFLIVCEGEKTEPNYFKSFHVPKTVIDGSGNNTIGVVEHAEQLSQDNDYDQVWCVFDRDSFPAQNFNAAISSAHAKGFKVAYSNEAFEIWYLLHFHFFNTGLSRKDYADKLEQCLKHPYKKNSETMYEEILPHQAKAIKYAENLLAQYDPHKPESDNPCTAVHELVKELNKYLS